MHKTDSSIYSRPLWFNNFYNNTININFIIFAQEYWHVIIVI